jgi:L-serine deaminase
MQRRQFVRIAGGGVVLAATAGVAGCSAELPSEAL